MNCIKCGTPLPDGAAFCGTCGASQTAPAPTANPAPAMQPQPMVQPQAPVMQPQPMVQPQAPAMQPQPMVQPQVQYQPQAPAMQPQPMVQPQVQYQPQAPAMQPQPNFNAPYGQQMNNGFGQPMYNQASAPATPGTVPPKKSHKGLIIALISIAVVIIAGLLVFFLVIKPNMDKKKKSKKNDFNVTMNVENEGINKLMAGANNTLIAQNKNNSITKFSSLANTVKETPMETSVSLQISGNSMSSMLTGLGITNARFISDPSTGHFSFASGISYASVEMLDFEITYTEKGLALASDDLFDGYVYVSPDDMADLMETAQGLMSGAGLGTSIPGGYDDYDYYEYDGAVPQTPMDAMEILGDIGDDLDDYVQDVLDCFADLLNRTTMTELSSKMIGSRSAEGYRLTVTKANIATFMKEMVEVLRKDFGKYVEEEMLAELTLPENLADDLFDINVDMYIDSDGNLLGLYLQQISEDLPIWFNLEFTGENEPSDHMEFTLYLGGYDKFLRMVAQTYAVNDGTTSEFYIVDQNLTRYQNSTVDFFLTVTEMNNGDFVMNLGVMDDMYYLNFSGNYADRNDGSSNLEIYALTIGFGSEYISFQGSVDSKPFTGSIKTPSGKGWNIRELTEDEALFEQFMTEVQQNIMSNPVFSSFMSMY